MSNIPAVIILTKSTVLIKVGHVIFNLAWLVLELNESTGSLDAWTNLFLQVGVAKQASACG